LVASSDRPLWASSSPCLIAERSSGEVAALAAMAKAGQRRAGGGGAATTDGLSGTLEGVYAGRGASGPARPMAPAGGTEDVAATGRAGAPKGVAVAAAFGGCLALSGLLMPSALCAVSADFSGRLAGFADLSAAGLTAGFFAAGFDVVSGAAGAFGSESGAASGAAAQRATAASVKQVSRTAFTELDLSAAMRRSHPSFERQRLKKS
jgi:hypothetical protein